MGLSFPFPFIDFLVIPTDAGAGEPRIEIDGQTGEIRVYDLNGDLFASITPADGFTVHSVSDANEFIRIDLLGGLPTLSLSTDDVDQTTPATLTGVIDGVGGTRTFELALATGNLSGNDRGRIELHSASEDGSLPSFVNIDSDDIQLLTRSLPRGITENGFNRQTVNDVARAAGVNTYSTVTTSLIAGRMYRVKAHGQANVGTAAVVYAMDCDYDGVIIGRFDRWVPAQVPAGQQTIFVDGAVEFEATADDASATFTVQNSAGSGGTMTIVGATTPFTLSVEDIGTDA